MLRKKLTNEAGQPTRRQRMQRKRFKISNVEYKNDSTSRSMGIRGWSKMATDTADWKKLVNEAKNSWVVTPKKNKMSPILMNF